MNFYDVLEISRTAGESEIKKAYHRLALKYHPDKNFGQMDPKFNEIKKAYDILSDPIQKQIYDNNIHTPVADWRVFMKDVMSNMYVLFTMYVIPKDIVLNIDVTFQEIYLSKVKKVDVRVKRWIDGKFCDITQSIYILLNSFKYEYVFKNNGDDSISKNKPRSDIIVKINIIDIPSNVQIQDIFSAYDLYIVQDISIADYYLKQNNTINIEIYPSFTTPLYHTGEFSYIIKSMGLPFTDQTTLEKKRGDVFIKFNVLFPDYPLPQNGQEINYNFEEFQNFLLKYFDR